jgi:hypothetical protein
MTEMNQMRGVRTACEEDSSNGSRLTFHGLTAENTLAARNKAKPLIQRKPFPDSGFTRPSSEADDGSKSEVRGFLNLEL